MVESIVENLAARNSNGILSMGDIETIQRVMNEPLDSGMSLNDYIKFLNGKP